MVYHSKKTQIFKILQKYFKSLNHPFKKKYFLKKWKSIRVNRTVQDSEVEWFFETFLEFVVGVWVGD